MEAKTVEGMAQRIEALEARVDELQTKLEAAKREDAVCLICFSGEWDRLFAALSIANGALAMGQEVHLFFTFWAVAALRNEAPTTVNPEKDFSQSMLARMLPAGAGKARLSRLNYMGLGKAMLRRLMKKHGVDDLDVLLRDAKELGAHIHLCDTSFGLFGLCCEELQDGETMERCGVATFLKHALRSRMVLFV
jgi:peroxiredoxin family protein